MKQPPEQHVERAKLKDLRELVSYGMDTYGEKKAFWYRKGDDLVCISYQRLFRDVTALGEYILNAGVEHGARIAVLGENSYAWVVTYLAVVNTGNVIVPIDKELKPAEIAVLLADSRPAIFVYSHTKEKCVRTMQEDGLSIDKMISMDDFDAILKEGADLLKSGSRLYESVRLDHDAMCAIIYTSGTTGDPKGVMLSQKNLAQDAYCSMSCMYIPDGTMAILPLNHTFGFMASVICQLWMGNSIFINNSLKTVLKDIQTAKPGHISVVPLFIENFYKNIWKAAEKSGKAKLLRRLITVSNALRRVGIDLRRPFFRSVINQFGGNLSMLITGGAPISDRYMKGFEDLGITIINGYGITECSPIVALNRNNNIRYGTVGAPIPGVSVKIDNPDSDGEGEICVKGDIVMLGYYHKEEETQNVLKDGWFRTGDIGKIKDGLLCITGRKKNLIILDNGKNVYPEEIETLLSFIENVTEVVVYQEKETIVAEIYSDAEGDMAAIRAQIETAVKEVNQGLAGYKQVKKVKFRETEFEKTTTKKIKRSCI